MLVRVGGLQRASVEFRISISKAAEDDVRWGGVRRKMFTHDVDGYATGITLGVAIDAS